MVTRRWLNGFEVVEKLGIGSFELFNFVAEGLQPYTYARKKRPPPIPIEPGHRIQEFLIQLRKKNILFWFVPYHEYVMGQIWPFFLKSFQPYIHDTGKLKIIFLDWANANSFSFLIDEEKSRKSFCEWYKKVAMSFSWCDYKLPDDDSGAIEIYNLLLMSLYRVEDIETIIATEATEAIIPVPVVKDLNQEARSRGGRAPKGNAAIMKAVKEFILQKNLNSRSVEYIARQFKKYHKDSPYIVTVDSVRYKVCYEDNRIYCDGEASGKYKNTSIARSTFLNKYIRKAKREVGSPKS